MGSVYFIICGFCYPQGSENGSPVDTKVWLRWVLTNWVDVFSPYKGGKNRFCDGCLSMVAWDHAVEMERCRDGGGAVCAQCNCTSGILIFGFLPSHQSIQLPPRWWRQQTRGLGKAARYILCFYSNVSVKLRSRLNTVVCFEIAQILPHHGKRSPPPRINRVHSSKMNVNS